MPRPKVPHCKKCIHLKNYNSFKMHYVQGAWMCMLKKEHINGQEIRTSPKWCPLRNKKE